VKLRHLQEVCSGDQKPDFADYCNQTLAVVTNSIAFVTADKRPVAVRVLDRQLEAARSAPAAPERVAAVPAGEDVARGDREPRGRRRLRRQLVQPRLAIIGLKGLHVGRVAELLLGVTAVGVGLVLVVALDVLEGARRRAGGVSRARDGQQCEQGQSARKSRST